MLGALDPVWPHVRAESAGSAVFTGLECQKPHVRADGGRCPWRREVEPLLARTATRSPPPCGCGAGSCDYAKTRWLTLRGFRSDSSTRWRTESSRSSWTRSSPCSRPSDYPTNSTGAGPPRSDRSLISGPDDPMTQPGDDDLDQLRTVDRADVFKAGRRAATLTRTEGGVEFRYLDGWISDGGPAVATTLPVVAEPVRRPGGALPAYFAGLLPEGRRLGALRRAVKTSADDELTLLLAVGADAIGDVQVVPSGVRPAEVPARVALEQLGDISFADLLVELGIRAQRVALPGVQEKTSAAMINLPVARAGDRYILKLNPAEYPHLVENEAFFLDGEWRVSPLYDVPSSDPYGDTTMALSIGDRSGGDFGLADFVALGGEVGVPERAVRRVLVDLADRVDSWLAELDSLPFDRGRISKLRRLIRYRRGRLAAPGP